LGEIELNLEGPSPLNLYGVNNDNLRIIRDFYPKIKIVARGNHLKAMGSEKELKRFVEKMTALIDRSLDKALSADEIRDVIEGESNLENSSPHDVILRGVKGNLIKTHSKNQKDLVDCTEDFDLLIASGPAGTGKTYTAVALAVKFLKEKRVRKIILTRPAVEAGESLGFLPGDLKDKMDPYLQPLYDALHDMIPVNKLMEYMQSGTIQIAPLAYMRGRTLDNAFVILDEAQNATQSQFKMFVTRMGKSAKFIVTGDVSQIDLANKSSSGLVQAIKLLGDLKEVKVIKFNEKDVMRHPIVKKIIKAYEAK